LKKRNTELVKATIASADAPEPDLGPVDGPTPIHATPDIPPASAPLPDAPEPTLALPASLPSPLAPDTTANHHPDAGEPGWTPPADPLLKPLEQRVRRLEDALAQIQEGKPRKPIPLATPSVPPPTAQLAPPNATEPAAAALVMAGAHLLTGHAPPTATQRQFWLLFDMVAETRAISRMFVDPRYKLSWMGRIVPLVLIVAFLTSDLWVSSAFGQQVHTVLVKAFDLLIGYLLFKVLTYEARRYRQTAPDLPPTLRL
jgi:hypothetical protein